MSEEFRKESLSTWPGGERRVQSLNHCHPVNKFPVDERRIPLGNHRQLGRVVTVSSTS